MALIVIKQKAVSVDPVPVPDEHSDKVVLLMHMEGPEGSTNFIDEKGHVFQNLGTSKISTAKSKFGNSSFNAFGRIQADCNFIIGLEDFTVEGFFYWTQSKPSYLIDGSRGDFLMGVLAGDNNNTINFYPGGYGGSGTQYVPLNQWVHIAFTRQERKIRMFVDGKISVVFSGNILNIQPSKITINGYGGGDGNSMPEGSFIDEIRITKGVARYTSDFAVPTAPFTID